MAIKGVVFDIGGVLEITPDLGVIPKWEQKLNLPTGELNKVLYDVWRGGSIGTITEAEVHEGICRILGMTPEDVHAFMEETWVEYLGTLNVELAGYFASLRPKVKTAILSNSFVGAREREEAAYRFHEMCDFIVYSHEVGMSKPDPRIYHLTCERLGLPPEEVLFVDDREGAVTAARECGLKAVLFVDNQQAIAEIEALLQGEDS